MGLVADVRTSIRALSGPIPKGTMLMVVQPDGTVEHIEDYRPSAADRELLVMTDSPDDTFLEYELPLRDGRVDMKLIPPLPAPRRPRKALAREKASDQLGEDLVEEIERFAHEELVAAVAVFQERLPGDWKLNRRTPPVLRLSWDPHRRASWGGPRSVSLMLAEVYRIDLFGGYFPIHFEEYAHIRNKPDIGSFHSDDWRDILAALVAHEVAHFLQCHVVAPWVDMERAHGSGWQLIYRILRQWQAERGLKTRKH